MVDLSVCYFWAICPNHAPDGTFHTTLIKGGWKTAKPGLEDPASPTPARELVFFDRKRRRHIYIKRLAALLHQRHPPCGDMIPYRDTGDIDA